MARLLTEQGRNPAADENQKWLSDFLAGEESGFRVFPFLSYREKVLENT